MAAVGPGLIRSVSLAQYRLLAAGDEVVVTPEQPCVLALDGEREVELRAGVPVRLRLNPADPRVVDLRRAVALAARAGIFVQPIVDSNEVGS